MSEYKHFRTRKIPENVDPLIQQFFSILNEEQATLGFVEKLTGVPYQTMESWIYKKSVPNVSNFVAALSCVGCRLVIERDGTKIRAKRRKLTRAQRTYTPPRNAAIDDRVSEEFGIDIDHITSKNRSQRLVLARRKLWSLYYLEDHRALAEIGRLFNVDHTSVREALIKLGIDTSVPSAVRAGLQI